MKIRHLVFAAMVLAAVGVVWAQPGHQAETQRNANAGVLMPRGEALARKAVERHGYDPKRHVLDTFGQELSEDGQTWSFLFFCGPISPPGCFTLVEVNRLTGKMQLHPGE